jgi:type I restriction enzyme M protein
MSLLEQGIKLGHVHIDEEKKFITYKRAAKRYRFGDPEEQVRAEIYLQLIAEYGYKPERIRIEVEVPNRVPNMTSDIVVFGDDELTRPYIVVECKKPTVSEAEFLQAIEQGFGYANVLQAEYLWVTAGIKSKYYDVKNFGSLERILNIIASIPRFGQTEISKAKFYKDAIDEDGNPAFELQIIEQKDLTDIFRSAHQALWAGGKRNPSEAFDELDKLIFCKIWDERKDRMPGEPYEFQEYTAEHPDFLLKRIKAIYEEGRLKDPEVFKEQIRLSANELKTIVSYLAPINLHDTDLDSKGRAFEAFMGSFFRGEFGQYFTPREVVDFIVKVLPISNNNLVLDTSCGSGGFLLYALNKVRMQADEFYPKFKTDAKQSNKHYKYWHDFAESNLYGIEISEAIARTAKMNMIIHDDGHTNVVTADGLLSADYWHPKSGETKEEIEVRENHNKQTIQGITKNTDFQYNRFDYIITNPPFGSIVKQAEQAYLKNYSLSFKDVNWIDAKQKGIFQLGHRDAQSTEVLFIEQCYRFLKPGGILAIVIPDGILTNSTSQYVRDWIEEHYRIISVVSLPQTAFSANGAGVKSSVMFLMKLTEKQTEQIVVAKQKLQDTLWERPEFSKEIQKLENEKQRIIKDHEGFDSSTISEEGEDYVLLQTAFNEKTKKKLIEKTEAFRNWKAEVSLLYNEKINEIKDNLQDEYLTSIGNEITNYDMVMAIAEDIGYDATGRKTGKNELTKIAKELSNFIIHIKTNKEPFFV